MNQVRQRVLLDEHVPRQLARDLPEYGVSMVAAQGWAGVLNGEPLRRVEAAALLAPGLPSRLLAAPAPSSP